MKKSLAIIFTAAFLASGLFAQSDADSYDDGNSTRKTAVKDAKTSKQSDENWLKEFFFGKEKYIEYDTIRCGTGTITYGIKAREATMLYNPETRKAGVRVYYQTNFYNVVFDIKNRQAITAAVNNYLNDFENKRLVRKSAKTKRAYGKGKAHIEWGTVKVMMDKFTDTEVWYGYTFIDGSPYFSIIVKQGKNQREHQSEYEIKESVEVQLYFNRAQAKELVRQLDQKILNEMQAEYEEYSNDSDSYSAKEDYVDTTEEKTSEPETVPAIQNPEPEAENTDAESEALEESETAEESETPEEGETDSAVEETEAEKAEAESEAVITPITE